MARQNCLREEELRAFLLGELPEDLSRAVTAHLENCPACEASARRLDGLADPFMRSLREILTTSPAGQPPTLPEAAGPTPRPGLETAVPSPVALPGYPVQPPGQFGRFRLLRELGRGGFGVVFLADDPALGRQVAVKVPRPEALADLALRARFLWEARAAARLDHPNVVPVHEAGEVGPVCYLVSAYCPGPTLAAWLRQQAAPVAPALAAAVVAALADAVQHAHAHGIFHRDLKPGNVLLTPLPAGEDAGADGLPFVPRLTDFGLAKLLEAEVDQTSSGVLLGTPAYMAPEQAEGWQEAAGAATDVYALGVILYELLTGRLPFLAGSVLLTLEQVRSGQPHPPRRWRPDLPRDLETICLKCLRRDPGQRYASAADLAADLRRFLRREPVHARPLGLLGHLGTWCRRPERIRDAGAIAFLIGITAIGTTSAGLISVVAGVLAARDPLAAAGYLLGFTLGFGPAYVWVAFRTRTRSLAALWLGLSLPFLLVAYQVMASVNYIPSGGVTEVATDPAAWEAQVATLLCLDLLQVAGFTVALMAYYANRHIPGFVPEQGRPGRKTEPVTVVAPTSRSPLD